MSKPGPPGGQPTSAARAQTLPLQGLVNRVNRGLLRTPMLCRLVGRRLLTMYLVGRKSGRHYAVPVAYTRRNGTLLVGTQSAWARNLAHPANRYTSVSPASGDPPMSMSWPTRPAPSST
jgi:hypothetical protein